MCSLAAVWILVRKFCCIMFNLWLMLTIEWSSFARKEFVEKLVVKTFYHEVVIYSSIYIEKIRQKLAHYYQSYSLKNFFPLISLGSSICILVEDYPLCSKHFRLPKKKKKIFYKLCICRLKPSSENQVLFWLGIIFFLQT